MRKYFILCGSNMWRFAGEHVFVEIHILPYHSIASKPSIYLTVWYINVRVSLLATIKALNKVPDSAKEVDVSSKPWLPFLWFSPTISLFIFWPVGRFVLSLALTGRSDDVKVY